MESFPSTHVYRLKVMKMLDRHERELSEVLDDPVVHNHAAFAMRSEVLLEAYRAKGKEARNEFAEEHIDALGRLR